MAEPRSKRNYNRLPPDALLRLPEVLELFPVSRSMWMAGVTAGVFPQPRKLGQRVSAWRLGDILALCRGEWSQHTEVVMPDVEREEPGPAELTVGLHACQAGRDGECNHPGCPQTRDREPDSGGRHCPLPHWTDDPEW